MWSGWERLWSGSRRWWAAGGGSNVRIMQPASHPALAASRTVRAPSRLPPHEHDARWGLTGHRLAIHQHVVLPQVPAAGAAHHDGALALLERVLLAGVGVLVAHGAPDGIPQVDLGSRKSKNGNRSRVSTGLGEGFVTGLQEEAELHPQGALGTLAPCQRCTVQPPGPDASPGAGTLPRRRTCPCTMLSQVGQLESSKSGMYTLAPLQGGSAHGATGEAG